MKTKQALFNFLKTHVDHRNYVVFSTTESNMLAYLKETRIKANEVFLGSMVRIVDVKSVIEAFNYFERTDFVMKVKDDQCEWNNKNFNVTFADNEATLEEISQSVDMSIDIGSLSQLIVGFRTASQLYDSWEIECAEEFIPVLDRLFPKQTNFFRDFF
ncbi:MAG: sterol carrier protein domain-containing protein [Candidatus Hodarchaeota archaeon]